MTDYAELKNSAEKTKSLEYFPPEPYDDDRRYSDAEIAWLEFVNTATPDLILALIAENKSLKGSCKAMGSRNIDKTLRENQRLKELVAKLQESARVAAEVKDGANRFGEGMEKERDQLKAENEALRKDAERYRCLRSTENWEDAFVGTPVYFEIYLVESRDGSDNASGDALDLVVDTLIGLREKNEG
jgi:hypothetical protein